LSAVNELDRYRFPKTVISLAVFRPLDEIAIRHERLFFDRPLRG
jgi:hypothetical protein